MLFVHSSAGRYGADRQLELLAGGLDPERYRALVVVPEQGALVDHLRDAGIETLIRPLAVLRRGMLHPRGLTHLAATAASNAASLSRLVRARAVDLVHSNTSVTIGGAIAARAGGVPHVWHVREIYTGFDRWWPSYRRLLLTADALPCVSAATRRQFAGASRARLVPDGLALAPTGGGGRRAAARARLGLAEQAFTCTVLGRLSDWKGQDVLLRALAEPALKSLGAVAVIAGDPWRGSGDRAEGLRALARGLGISERAHFVGFVADAEGLYDASDVVVVPSTRPDPLPNSALEAAAAGCCVVASDLGGLPEIISDGRTGRLIGPGDPRALAAVLSELAGDAAQRRRLGAAAAAETAARFRPERLLERVQALYDEVIRLRGPARPPRRARRPRMQR